MIKSLIGLTSVASIQAVDYIPTSLNFEGVIKIAFQIVIGVVSLWHLLKKNNNDLPNQNK